jgi:CheY-like chemotaxis protein
MSEKILIIDDDLDTLRLVGLMLQRQGYQISAATNGQQGLEKAFEEDPDLVLLDIMMPDMDGYEVTRRLRQNPSTLETPILMFTAKTQLDDKVVGFEVGANDYLTKPTSPRIAGSGEALRVCGKGANTLATREENLGLCGRVLEAGWAGHHHSSCKPGCRSASPHEVRGDRGRDAARTGTLALDVA